jgi:hypothetical protein
MSGRGRRFVAVCGMCVTYDCEIFMRVVLEVRGDM